jgi:hypothetical protein
MALKEVDDIIQSPNDETVCSFPTDSADKVDTNQGRKEAQREALAEWNKIYHIEGHEFSLQTFLDDYGRTSVLKEADNLICEDRNKSYGPVYSMYDRIASGWSTILNTNITKEQIGMMMVWMKIARLINAPNHRDSWVDVAGYAALTAEIAEWGDASDPVAVSNVSRERDKHKSDVYMGSILDDNTPF